MTDLQLNRLSATLELRTQEADDLRAELAKLRAERDDARRLLEQSQTAEMRLFDRAEKAEQERDALAETIHLIRATFHVNMIRAYPDKSHEDIRALINSAIPETEAAILAARDARVKAEALKSVADQLRKAGASVPAPENKGTIESAMATGLSIALVIVEQVMADAIEKEADRG